MKHLSIDLESFVHIDPCSSASSEERKRMDNGFIVSAVRDILCMLRSAGSKATFFVLGEVYGWYPELIAEIKKEGHEIGWHSHSHRIIKSASVLKDELEKSRDFIGKFKPKGFRAPQMFLTGDSLALLRENGFLYDSSLYGRDAFSGVVEELPVTTFFSAPKSYPQSLGVKNLFRLPFGSGFFFGVFGSFTAVKDVSLFVHPWQVACFPLKFRLAHILRDFRLAPYLINRRRGFLRMLGRCRFAPFIELLGEDSSGKDKIC